MKAARHPRLPHYTATIGERLASKVRPAAGGCMEFVGSRNWAGYGQIGAGGKGCAKVGAHRVAWELANGEPVPEGMYVCHSCDNPPCCNPAHLFVGSPTDNVTDAASKGRLASGDRHHRMKITDEQVAELRRLAPTAESFAALGRQFGIPRSHARLVALGRYRS